MTQNNPAWTRQLRFLTKKSKCDTIVSRNKGAKMQFDNIDDYDEIRQIGWEKNDAYFGDVDYEDEVYELYEEESPIKDKKRTIFVNSRYTMDELLEITEQAQIAGISRSAFVRKRALGHKIVSNTDLTILRELRRIGGLIKHLYSQGLKSNEMDNAWDSLQSLFKTISNNFNGGTS